MKVELLNKFLEDLTYFSEYEFLEEANQKEFIEVAKKFGIKFPNYDLAPFKCIYAYVDRVNKNGCRLPKEEVEKALETLRGKAIDFDHVRQRTVGYWIDAKLVKDKIIAYGVFFKSNLKEDYNLIKDLMQKGNLKVSFEAWGNREFNEDGTYDLKDIDFAGGALLLTTTPAFEGAEVLELAKQKVLEFASVMTPPKTFIRSQEGLAPADPPIVLKRVEEEKIITTRYFQPKEKVESKTVRVTTVYWSDGKKDVYTEEINRNELFRAFEEFFKDKKTKCSEEEFEMDDIKEVELSYEELTKEELEDLKGFFEEDEEQDVEEAKRLSYEERKKLPDSMFAVVIKVKNKKTGEIRKIRKYPLNDETRVRAALRYLGMPRNQKALKKLGVSIESVRKKILKRAKELNMKSLLERYKNKGAEMEEKIKELEQEIAQLKGELQKKDAVIAELKKESEEAKAKIEEIEKAKEKEIKKAKEEARIVTERRAELGEFAKDVKDEDLLDDVKFENLKLKKEIAELKKDKQEKGYLETGSSDKDKEEEVFKRQKSIREKAFGA